MFDFLESKFEGLGEAIFGEEECPGEREAELYLLSADDDEDQIAPICEEAFEF